MAEAAKDAGNTAFKNKDYAAAVTSFTEAIKLSPEKVEYYSNRSAAYLKAGQHAEALADADKCVSLNPEWSKGYSRQGATLFAMKEYTKAVAAYAAGMAIEPDNENLTEGLHTAQDALAAGAKKKKKKKGKKAKEEEAAKEGASADASSVIGIDLGTTYSCVGVWENDAVTIIENSDGQKTIPSYVSFNPTNGERLVGHAAKNQSTRFPKNVVYDVKRIIGQRMTDTGVETDISKMQYAVVKDEEGKPMVQVDVKGEKVQYAPEEISAMVLTYCKELAEKYLGREVTRAVVTVPAYFNDQQRQATKAAGRIAGLDVLRIINEPTAAALSYGLDNAIQGTKAMNVLIFDLGGGTFDVSILTIEGGVFTVKATGGDTRLGGEDFDNNVVEYLITEVEKQGIPNPRNDARSIQRLRKAAEQAKREVSISQTAEIRLDAFMEQKHNFHCKLSRAKFESLNKGPFAMCIDTVKRVLKDAKLKPEDIHEIVLVGGSTRIPKLQEMLISQFNGKTLCKSLNPDEAVAYGAAIQGAILNGKRNSKTDSLLLMDVTPLSLGIETTGRVMSVVIPRNTPIPCVKTQTYTTEANYQTKVDVSVYEGERLKSDENNLLGEFTIDGIEAAKRGEPQIDVSFSIDSNGILNVTAQDQKTRAKAKITISNRSRATTDEIDAMVAEAERYRTEDKERMRKVEVKNEMEQVILECLSAAQDEGVDGKLAGILQSAAEKEQAWLDDNYEDAKASEIALRKQALSRRLKGKTR
jgi:L1 cell adhesion molecule like protein